MSNEKTEKVRASISAYFGRNFGQRNRGVDQAKHKNVEQSNTDNHRPGPANRTKAGLEQFGELILAKENQRNKVGVVSNRDNISTTNPPKTSGLIGDEEYTQADFCKATGSFKTSGQLKSFAMRSDAGFGGDREFLTKEEKTRRAKSIEDNIIGSSKIGVPNIGRPAGQIAKRLCAYLE